MSDAKMKTTPTFAPIGISERIPIQGIFGQQKILFSIYLYKNIFINKLYLKRKAN